jgi:prepilin-type N-terminal cleavage/methylation domain-containing protein
MRTSQRKGFTLVELLVAMALTIFIMVILTEAFVLSIDTFSGLKGIGDMQENLRAGTNSLRFDLAQNHFEGMVRTSDPGFANQPPREGFVRIYQGAASISEGLDGDQMPSFNATNHVLHMSCRLRGNQQQSFYSAQVTDPSGVFFANQTFYNLDPAVNPQAPADATLTVYPNPPTGTGFFRSQWAEVAYFLAPQGTSEEPLVPGPNGTPLYGLYRAQFLVVTDATRINGKIPVANLGGLAALSCVSNGAAVNPTITFFTPNDLAKSPPTRTFLPANPGAARTWPPPLCSLLVPNVVSFQVQGIVNSGTPQDINYDSASTIVPPQPSLKGVFITIRVWDNKTRQTRQTSIIQDL